MDKTMRNLLVTFAISLLFIGLDIKISNALGGRNDAGISGSFIMSGAITSTGTQVFVGRGWVKSVFYSTNTADAVTGKEYWLMADTVALPNFFSTALTTNNVITPGVVFASTYNATTAGSNLGFFDFGDPVFISSGCFMYKTSAASGEALRAFIKFKR